MKRRYLLSVIFITILYSQLAIAQPDRPGIQTVIGETVYFVQHNTSMGKTITVDNQNRIHFVWSDMDANQSRSLKYNCLENGEAGFGAGDAATVDTGRGAQPTIAVFNDHGEDKAVIFYMDRGSILASIDFGGGWGAYQALDFGLIGFEPKGCISRSGDMIVSTVGLDQEGAHTPGQICRATVNEDLWLEREVQEPIEYESTLLGSQVLTASRTSDRVALVWHHNRLGIPVPENWDGYVAGQMENDIYVVISEDGSEWDLENPINVTKTIPANLELEDVAAYGDTLRPYADLDAIWVGDVLHVVFTTRGFKADLTGEAVPPVESITINESLIWHWDSETDTLTLVANGWFENELGTGYFSANVCKPSLGADADGNLYCIYRQAIPEDRVNDRCASDIMLTRSSDGIVWRQPWNLTHSHLEANQEGHFINELDPCLAEVVDTAIHLMYQKGSTDMDPIEGGQSEALVISHEMPLWVLEDEDPLPMPVEGFQYHNYPPEQVSESNYLPVEFGIREVYPNPFNGMTKITVELDFTREIDISVYDQQGRKAASLLVGSMSPGQHEVVWDASNAGAGLYWVRLRSNDAIQTSKVVLIK